MKNYTSEQIISFIEAVEGEKVVFVGEAEGTRYFYELTERTSSVYLVNESGEVWHDIFIKSYAERTNDFIPSLDAIREQAGDPDFRYTLEELEEQAEDQDPRDGMNLEFYGIDDEELQKKIVAAFIEEYHPNTAHTYKIMTDEEADEQAAEYIKNSLWTFNASFISCHTKNGLNDRAEKALEKMLGNLGEDANDIVEAMIEDIDEFIEDAIRADGRGHFLSTYDGEEREITVNGETYYIYAD
jgi:hypothetical protein